jgi:hypothetical protein
VKECEHTDEEATQKDKDESALPLPRGKMASRMRRCLLDGLFLFADLLLFCHFVREGEPGR